jgi:hypothetical protein
MSCLVLSQLYGRGTRPYCAADAHNWEETSQSMRRCRFFIRGFPPNKNAALWVPTGCEFNNPCELMQDLSIFVSNIHDR